MIVRCKSSTVIIGLSACVCVCMYVYEFRIYDAVRIPLDFTPPANHPTTPVQTNQCPHLAHTTLSRDKKTRGSPRFQEY